jgi:hypothetical protein
MRHKFGLLVLMGIALGLLACGSEGGPPPTNTAPSTMTVRQLEIVQQRSFRERFEKVRGVQPTLTWAESRTLERDFPDPYDRQRQKDEENPAWQQPKASDWQEIQTARQIREAARPSTRRGIVTRALANVGGFFGTIGGFMVESSTRKVLEVLVLLAGLVFLITLTVVSIVLVKSWKGKLGRL